MSNFHPLEVVGRGSFKWVEIKKNIGKKVTFNRTLSHYDTHVMLAYISIFIITTYLYMSLDVLVLVKTTVLAVTKSTDAQ